MFGILSFYLIFMNSCDITNVFYEVFLREKGEFLMSYFFNVSVAFRKSDWETRIFPAIQKELDEENDYIFRLAIVFLMRSALRFTGK